MSNKEIVINTLAVRLQYIMIIKNLKKKTNLFHATELRLHAFINMVFLHLLRHSEMTGFGSKFRKIGNTGQ